MNRLGQLPGAIPKPVKHAANRTGNLANPRFPNVNITQTAKQLGMSKSYLSKVLRGTCRPGLEAALRISRSLGVPVEELNSYKPIETVEKDLDLCPSKKKRTPGNRSKKRPSAR
jgi:transcriptional regulator with XRE-family HTH domain